MGLDQAKGPGPGRGWDWEGRERIDGEKDVSECSYGIEGWDSVFCVQRSLIGVGLFAGLVPGELGSLEEGWLDLRNTFWMQHHSRVCFLQGVVSRCWSIETDPSKGLFVTRDAGVDGVVPIMRTIVCSLLRPVFLASPSH